MTVFTKQLRQQIVREFSDRHGGIYIPTLFLEEVRQAGESHPAYEWFEWNRDQAAQNYQVEQARDFARGLKVTFSVEEIGRARNVTIRETTMPFVLSPMGGRKDGGGYYIVDPSNPVHQRENCRQAAMDLRAWMQRYEAALRFVPGSSVTLQKIAAGLEKASKPHVEAAE